MHKLISLSGGKDSTALALLAIETKAPGDVLDFVFCDTGNEHPITYSYIEYLDRRLRELSGGGCIRRLRADFSEKIFLRRDKLLAHPDEWGGEERAAKAKEVMLPSFNPFLDCSIVHGRFPSTCVRFCTQELKVDPIKKYLKTILAQGVDCESWVGVRAGESQKRAKLPSEELFLASKETGAECWTKRPILTWKPSDVFAFLKKHDVEPNPLYKMGFARVGCMPCVGSSKADLKEIATRFPAEIHRIAAWEDVVKKVSKTGTSTFFHSKGAKGVWEMVEWSKTERGQIGYTHELFDEDLACCKSIYGLCE